MKPDRVYEVSADHSDEEYRANREIVTVNETDAKFVATARSEQRYGSSPPCNTPEEAIQKLFGAKGCTNIRVIYSSDV